MKDYSTQQTLPQMVELYLGMPYIWIHFKTNFDLFCIFT